MCGLGKLTAPLHAQADWDELNQKIAADVGGGQGNGKRKMKAKKGKTEREDGKGRGEMDVDVDDGEKNALRVKSPGDGNGIIESGQEQEEIL